jgi:hypothetical protein
MLIHIDEAEHATLLAALRYYQQRGFGEPVNRPDDIHELAAPDHVMSSLDQFGIERLFEGLDGGARDVTGAVEDLVHATSGDYFTDAPECSAAVERIERCRDSVAELARSGPRDANYVRSVRPDDEAPASVDIVLLQDGQALAINGEAVVLFPNLAAYDDPETDASGFPTIELPTPLSPAPRP